MVCISFLIGIDLRFTFPLWVQPTEERVILQTIGHCEIKARARQELQKCPESRRIHSM